MVGSATDTNAVVTPLGEHIGARIDGVDLAAGATPELRRLIREAILRHKVLVLPGQKLDAPAFHDFARGTPYRIDDRIEVIPTPGHTARDVSVIVKTKQGVVAIVGDLFECAEDLENENLWRSSSEMPEMQKTNRERILDLADFIVPGHGEMFRVA